MDKTIIALGLMSGTSMDGIDASLIRTDGEKNIEIIGNFYLKYDLELKNSLYDFCYKINNLRDIDLNKNQLETIERKITILHAEASTIICKKYNIKPSLVGLHGQTILHNPKEKCSIQLGNAKLLSQLLKKDVVYQFRKNDILNGGEGAPLTPIYHHNLARKLNINNPIVFLNIGGIANFTYSNNQDFFAKDVGPGNCLMDSYLKKTKKLEYDKDGMLASSGNIDNTLINNILDNEYYNTIKKHSFDIKDFDINFVRGLSTEDALANLNLLTAKIIANNLKKEINDNFIIILCGGGRKNKTLVENLKNLINKKIINIDDFNIDGDFIESQAFAYLSVRSLFKKNISYPNTTKVSQPITAGELIKFN